MNVSNCCSGRNRWEITNKKLAMLFITIPFFWQKFINSGLTGSFVTTIENYFSIASFDLAFMMGAYEVFKSVGLIGLFFIGNNLFKPRCVGVGTIVMAIGYICLTIPFFVDLQNEQDKNETRSYLTLECHDGDKNNGLNMKYLFAFGLGMAGLGSSCLYTCGVTYIDQGVNKKTSAVFNSVFHNLGGIGVALGVICGGAIVNVYIKPWESIDLATDNKCWFGAWWLGYLVFSIPLLFSSIPLFFLPRYLKTPTESSENAKRKISHKLKKIFSLFIEPGLILNQISAGSTKAFLEVSRTFLVKYLEIQFNLSPLRGAIAYGLLSLPPGILAHTANAAVFKKFTFSVTSYIKYNILCSIMATAFACGFLMQDHNLASTTSKNNTDLELPKVGECGTYCHCVGVAKTNVTNEFSTLEKHAPPKHTNCSCTPATGEFYSTSPALVAFCVCCSLSIFFTLLSQVPSKLITLRLVDSKRKVSASSMHVFMCTVFGSAIGRIIAGKILDHSCSEWVNKCSKSSCLTYDRNLMSSYVTALLVSEGVFNFLTNILLLYHESRKTTQQKIAMIATVA